MEKGDKKMIVKNWVEDDRKTCKTCVEGTRKKMQHNMPVEVFEKVRKVNHPANRWMFDLVQVRGGWAKAEFEQDWCEATGLPCLPMDLPHRCDFYKGVGSEVVVGDREGGQQWWE